MKKERLEILLKIEEETEAVAAIVCERKRVAVSEVRSELNE